MENLNLSDILGTIFIFNSYVNHKYININRNSPRFLIPIYSKIFLQINFFTSKNKSISWDLIFFKSQFMLRMYTQNLEPSSLRKNLGKIVTLRSYLKPRLSQFHEIGTVHPNCSGSSKFRFKCRAIFISVPCLYHFQSWSFIFFYSLFSFQRAHVLSNSWKN